MKKFRFRRAAREINLVGSPPVPNVNVERLELVLRDALACTAHEDDLDAEDDDLTRKLEAALPREERQAAGASVATPSPAGRREMNTRLRPSSRRFSDGPQRGPNEHERISGRLRAKRTGPCPSRSTGSDSPHERSSPPG